MGIEVLKAKRRKSTTPGEARPVSTRHIAPATAAMLWGLAAGRCEFAGCNKPLWRSPVTQESVNLGEKAHIYSFSSDGPRGNAGLNRNRLNDHENLMLVCPECHNKIDNAPDGGRYTVSLLQDMKSRHESRIEIVTGIEPGRRSHVLMYGANIGDHSSPRLPADAITAMFPDRYPATTKPITIGVTDSSQTDRTEEFWARESEQLKAHFNQRVRERISSGEIDHLSVFALAPQPLLLLLGSFLGDIVSAEVYQRHREPQTWSWPAQSPATPDFKVLEPESSGGSPALVFSVSATVTADRVRAVLGPDASIWVVSVDAPHNDIIKSRLQLSKFRSAMRILLDRIKATHGQTTILNLFPAMPASLAVELGRVRMPKTDMPWRVFDQVNARGGFVPALSIPNGEDK